MTSEISLNLIGKLFDLGLAAQGADPLAAAGSTDLGTFDAVLRKLDMSGEATGELADDSDAPDQTMAIPGNTLPVASLIDLPGGNVLPIGGETPGAGEISAGSEHLAQRTAIPMPHAPSPDALLAKILPGGLPVAQAIQPPQQFAIAPLPAGIPAGNDAPARGDGASNPSTLNPAAMTASLLVSQAVPQAASDAASNLQLPTGQSHTVLQQEPSIPGQQPDQPGQVPAPTAPASQDRAPSPIEAAMKEVTALFPPRPQSEEGEGASLQPADALARHRTTEPPSAPLAHSSGEVAPPGISRALEGPAAPHLAEALENLVERLADARDRVREARGEMVLRHTDFGAIRAQIAERAEGLQVALSSRDPDFAPSAQAALGERGPQGQFQQQAWGNGNSPQGRAKWQGSQEPPPGETAAPRRRDLGGERAGPSQKNGLFA